MSITALKKVFNVGESEYAYLAEATAPTSTGKVSLHIPKLMGNLNGEGPDTINTSGLFANSKECMPVFSTKVTRVKSIRAQVKKNCNWLGKVNSAGVVPAGTQFIVEFLNGNIASPYVTTK